MAEEAPQRPKEQMNDDMKNYVRPDFFEVSQNQIAYHFDEICRIVSDAFEGTKDPRTMSIVKLKLEEAMVWMMHTGVMKRPVMAAPPPAPPRQNP